MNVVDSGGWLEYFADGTNPEFSAPVVEDLSELIVPTLSLYEVFKRVFQQRGEGDALQAIAVMMQGIVVDLNPGLALSAARTSVEMSLPMADSVMLATALAHGATLWTQDADFEGIAGVKYIRKPYAHLSKGDGSLPIFLSIAAGATAFFGEFVENALENIGGLSNATWNRILDLPLGHRCPRLSPALAAA